MHDPQHDEQIEAQLNRLDAIATRQEEIIRLLIGERSLADVEAEDVLGDLHSGGPTSRGSSWRDAEVLSQLTPGETVTLAQLDRLYRANTDIRNPRTIKKRIEVLTKSDAFERAGLQMNTWTYVGDSDE